MDERAFKTLTDYLEKVPAIQTPIGTGADEKGIWWIKFSIDIHHDLAWNVVQELACVVNYLSLNERLPTIFIQYRPPPILMEAQTNLYPG